MREYKVCENCKGTGVLNATATGHDHCEVCDTTGRVRVQGATMTGEQIESVVRMHTEANEIIRQLRHKIGVLEWACAAKDKQILESADHQESLAGTISQLREECRQFRAAIEAAPHVDGGCAVAIWQAQCFDDVGYETWHPNPPKCSCWKSAALAIGATE